MVIVAATSIMATASIKAAIGLLRNRLVFYHLCPIPGDHQPVRSLPEDRIDLGRDPGERLRDLVVARPLCVILF